MNFQYTKKPNSMYINRHENPDVVEYHKQFVKRWKGYELQMITYNNNSKVDCVSISFSLYDS